MNSHLKDCTGVILAGGENRRMPVLKAFIEVDGEKIIERNLKIMKKLFKEIFIVTNQPEAYLYLGIPLLGDIYNVRGPMTGVLTSLLNSSTHWVFISACDMPFINEHLIRYMAAKRDNYDAVAPMLKSKIEPLFTFYSKRLILYMEKAIIASKTGLQDFLDNKRVKYIFTEEIKNIAPGAGSFININTSEDVKFYLRPEVSQRN
jgi:molybdopterin-guanine dinucleotide biosynthesis protein A